MAVSELLPLYFDLLVNTNLHHFHTKCFLTLFKLWLDFITLPQQCFNWKQERFFHLKANEYLLASVKYLE